MRFNPLQPYYYIEREISDQKKTTSWTGIMVGVVLETQVSRLQNSKPVNLVLFQPNQDLKPCWVLEEDIFKNREDAITALKSSILEVLATQHRESKQWFDLLKQARNTGWE